MDSSSSSSSSCESCGTCRCFGLGACVERSSQHLHPTSGSYRILQVLGEGSYGLVVKCVIQETGKTMALKIHKEDRDARQEEFMMRYLMKNNLDQFNIIKYEGELLMRHHRSLMFELLDISLQDYLKNFRGPKRLQDIRTVIQQLATALEALKRVGVIHSDLKIDNIMMVDHVRQPFRVKLIDFGLARFRFQAKQLSLLQAPQYRAPEIILGLPFSEAIDVWSLGTVMGLMMFECMLFPARNDYDALRFIIDLIGPPPEHLITAGKKSNYFFKKTESNEWRLKTPEEYWGSLSYVTSKRSYTFRSLDEVKKMRLEVNNAAEADERRECTELLKAMLKWDEKERITPTGILNHPFITENYSSSHFSSCSTSKELPSGVIMVQEAAPMNRFNLVGAEETPDEDRDISSQAAASTLNTTKIHPDNAELPPSGPEDSKEQKKKKKRKNCFRRFCSWMRRTFCSCCSTDDVLD